MDNFKCSICSNNSVSRVIKRKVGGQITECAICGHLMLWPKLHDEEVISKYTYSYRIEASNIGVAIFDNMAYKLLRRSDKRKNLEVLDVGCGLGEFLHVCTKSGNNVIGIDITKSIVDQLNQKGFQVYQKSLSEFCSIELNFDWVSCLNMIEHVNDPLLAIKQLANLVRPGGRIAIQTPNGSAIAKHTENSYGLHVDEEHINYFRPDQLIRILSQYNFSLIYKKYYPTNIRLGRVKMPKANVNSESISQQSEKNGTYRKKQETSGVRYIVQKLPPFLRGIIRTCAQLLRYCLSIDEIITGTAHEYIIVMKRNL